MRGHLMSFSFLSAWHGMLNYQFKPYFTFTLTLPTKDFAGLKEGIKCSGIMMVVFFEMLRAVF